jgi:hypothetical protein
MATKAQTTRAKAEAKESAYPPWWNWEEDGLAIGGSFVAFGEGVSRGDWTLFVTLAIDTVDGEKREPEERTVWLHHDALRSKFFERVERLGPIELGERVEIERSAEKRLSGGGFEYFPFAVRFPDAPQLDQEALLARYRPARGSKREPEPGEKPEPQDEAAGEDDDVPF